MLAPGKITWQTDRSRGFGSLEATSSLLRRRGRRHHNFTARHSRASTPLSFHRSLPLPSERGIGARSLSYGACSSYALRLARAGRARAPGGLPGHGHHLVPAHLHCRLGLFRRVAEARHLAAPSYRHLPRRPLRLPLLLPPRARPRHPALWIEEGQENRRRGCSGSEGAGEGRRRSNLRGSGGVSRRACAERTFRRGLVSCSASWCGGGRGSGRSADCFFCGEFSCEPCQVKCTY